MLTALIIELFLQMLALAEDETALELGPSDTAVIIMGTSSKEVAVWTSEQSLRDWYRFVAHTDDGREQFLAEQEKSGKHMMVIAGTPVRIVRAFDLGHTLPIADVETEVTDGPLKGRRLFLSSMDLGPPGTKPLKRYEPQEGYRPRVGDRIVLYSADKGGDPFTTVTVFDGPSSYREYYKALHIRDDAGLKDLEERKEALEAIPFNES